MGGSLCAARATRLPRHPTTAVMLDKNAIGINKLQRTVHSRLQLTTPAPLTIVGLTLSGGSTSP